VYIDIDIVIDIGIIDSCSEGSENKKNAKKVKKKKKKKKKSKVILDKDSIEGDKNNKSNTTKSHPNNCESQSETIDNSSINTSSPFEEKVVENKNIIFPQVVSSDVQREYEILVNPPNFKDVLDLFH
jgi:hypothetical protein